MKPKHMQLIKQLKLVRIQKNDNFNYHSFFFLVYENHNYRMNNISPEWFYETILLKYPSIVFKYRSWFEHIKIDVIPNGNDMIKLKQWQIALMLHAQIKAEQQQQKSSNEN